MKFKFLFFLVFLGLGVQTSLSWAQSDIRTTSNNLRNQFHRNLLGQCSASSIDCGPMTANPGGGTVNGPQSLQRVDAVAPGEARCVSGFGTADGTDPGLAVSTANDVCLTTAGILWAGGSRVMDAGACGNTRFCNQFFQFTGLPRIPTGADTQFGVGAKSDNRLDIGGTANDSLVPAGSSTGLINYTIRHDIKDSLTGGGYADCGNFDTDCQTAFKITWSAPKPSNCTTATTPGCPDATIIGNGFESVNVSCPGGVTGPCREHRIRYGFTQKWVGAVTENEGNSGTSRGQGQGMQEHLVSFSIVSQTNGNGDLISDPTGFYFVEMACIGNAATSFSQCADTNETDIERTTPRFVGFNETGSFSTSVTFPLGVPTISVTLTQTGPATGCQHDSNGTTCIDRVAPAGLPDPFLP